LIFSEGIGRLPYYPNADGYDTAEHFFLGFHQNVVCTFCTNWQSFGYCLFIPQLKEVEAASAGRVHSTDLFSGNKT
jgi:hypothetical protein